MELHSSVDRRTEQLEETLYDSLVCIVDATLALDRMEGAKTPELAGWIAQYSGKPHQWRNVLGAAAIRRIQRSRREKGGAYAAI